MSLQNSPMPYYPDLQMLSATFGGASSNVTVNTKFRQVVGIDVTLLAAGANQSSFIDIAGNAVIASANKGQITVSLVNASGTVSSARSLNIWTTGVM